MKNFLKKYKKIIISIISVALVAVIIAGGYFGNRFFGNTLEYKNSYDEIYSQEKVTLNTDESGILKVLKINDTHFYNGTCENDAKTLADLKVILDKTPCDFIVANGDIVDGFNLVPDYDKQQALELFAELIESYEIPWTFLPGNNDGEIDGENEDIIGFLMQYEHFICGNEEGLDGDMQFFVDVKSNGELVHTIALMDSHARTIKAIGRYDYMKENQINWLLEGINERKVKTSVFFHMNTPAFKTAFEEGEHYEDFPSAYVAELDTIKKNALFDDMTADNEYISLLSIGHVHPNNMCALYNNRYYQLSSVSGYNAGHPEDMIPSCTLTVIDTTKTETAEMYHFEKVVA